MVGLINVVDFRMIEEDKMEIQKWLPSFGVQCYVTQVFIFLNAK